ncbi:MAG: hypothetical protein ACOYN4_13895, partial [Bacteroidales bacterium]
MGYFYLRRYFILIGLFSLITFSCYSQTDTRFWFVAPEATVGHGDEPIWLRLSSYSIPSTVTISMPANPSGFTPITVVIPAHGTYSLELTSWKEIIENKPGDVPLNKGILIEASQPITAAYDENSTLNSGLFSLLGSNALGKDFLIPAQNLFYNNSNYSPSAYNSFDIVATEDNTQVTITPSNNIVGHLKTAGAFTIILQRGQTYSAVATNQLAAGHLTGTKVTSNKPIAITLKDDSITAPNGTGCADIIMDQIFPTNILGNDYIIVRGYMDNAVNDRVVILASQNNTQLFRNGNAISFSTLQSGESTSLTLLAGDSATFIHSDKPVYVLHLTGYTCELGSSIIPPIGCTGSSEVAITRSNDYNFGIILFTKNGAQDDFLIDGSVSTLISPSKFYPVPGNPMYVYARIEFPYWSTVNLGAHIIENTTERFHLGVISANSSGNASCRYGYFSNFGTLLFGSDRSVCSGESVVLDGGVGRDHYLWSTGETTRTITVTSAGTYFVTASDNDLSCTVRDTIQISFRPTPVPSISTNLGVFSVCEGTSGVTYTTDVGMANYIWSVGPGGAITGGQGTNQISVTWNSAGSNQVCVTYTNTEGCTATPAKCETVIVNAPVTPTFPQIGSFCLGAVPDILPGTSTNGITGTWSPASISTAVAGTAPYTFTPTIGLCALSTVLTITVNPAGQVDQPSSQVFCQGATTPITTFSTSNTAGTTTYTWTNSLASIGLGISGSGSIPIFTATNTGSIPVIADIIVTPYFTNGGKTCAGPTKQFSITVNPAGQVNQPTSQVFCQGETTTVIPFNTINTVGTTTYTWTNNQTSIGLGSTGSGSIPIFTASNTGTSPVVATLTITPHFTNASKTCDGPTKQINITVNPSGQVNQPASQIFCHGEATPILPFSTGNSSGITSYTWSNSQTSIGLAGLGSGSIPIFTATNTGSSPVIADIVITPHFTNGGKTCDGPTKQFNITVNPSGQVNQPASQVFCHGETSPVITFTTNNIVATTTYTWSNNQTSIGLTSSGSGSIPIFIATNTGTSPIIATIEVTPHFTSGGKTCDGPTKQFNITVNPSGQVNQPTSQVFCQGETTTAIPFSSNNTVGTTTYTWSNNQSSIGLGISGSGSIPTFTASNTGSSPIIAAITVTPYFTNGGKTCTGSTKQFSITVNPAGQVNQPINQVFCQGETTPITTFST